MRCERKILNTEAESVDDMVAAKSMEPIRLNAMTASCCQNEMPYTKKPVNTVVSNTPNVASTTPGAHTGRISSSFVSMPPVNKMMLKATMPMRCAPVASSN